MEIVRALFSEDVEEWLERRREDRVMLRWFGSAAEALVLTGEADSEMARQVLCDGIGPNGERLDGQGLTVAYWVEFRSDSTVRDLAANSGEDYEAVLEAHRLAMAAALEALEEDVRLGLVGVATERSEGMSDEIVFLASASHPVLGWEPLDTPTAVLNVVLPAARRAFTIYQDRLGAELAHWLELAHRLEVEVDYEDIPDTGLPIAFVQPCPWRITRPVRSMGPGLWRHI